MPWWSWLLIWAVLILGLIGMLAAFAWNLFRRGLGILRQLEELLDRMGRIAERQEELSLNRARSSLFVDRDELREARRRTQEGRAERRDVRRAARIRRGKLLVHRNPSANNPLVRAAQARTQDMK